MQSHSHIDPDLENIDVFAFTEDDIDAISVSTNKKRRIEAKKRIDSLVSQNNDELTFLLETDLPTTVPVSHKKSKYIVDLTAREKAVKNNKHLFERPAAKLSLLPSILFREFRLKPSRDIRSQTSQSADISIQTIEQQLHTPDFETSSKKIKEASSGVHENNAAVELQSSRSWVSVVVFASILMALIVPLKTVVVAEQLLTTKNNLLVLGYEAFNSFKAGSEAGSEDNFEDAVRDFQSAASKFDEIKQTVSAYNQVFVSIVENLPSVGVKVKTGEALIDIGHSLSQAAAIFSQAADKQLSTTDALQATDEQVLNIITVLRKAEKNIDLVQLKDVDEGLAAAIQTLAQDLPIMIKQLEQIEKGNRLAYKLLGGDRLSRVLLVFQNNRELRPTGGFMGSYALADFQKGELKNFELPSGGTYDTEAGLLETIVPPYPLQLVSSRWQLWDSNWWPDYPTSAQKISDVYQKATGQTVDYVVAVNSDFVVDVLELVGDISIQNTGTSLGADNFYTVIQAEVEDGANKALNRPKQILADAAPELITAVETYNDKLALASIFLEGLASKDIQVYATESTVQQQITELNWDGGQLASPRDYLQVVTTNIAGGKTDSYINMQVDHRAKISAHGAITVTTKITKSHNAPSDDPYGYINNVDYIRIYVPRGSKLLSAGGFDQPSSDLFDDIPDYAVTDDYFEQVSSPATLDDISRTRINVELDKTVYGNWMQIMPGETKTVYFEYELPFKLYFSKNSGSRFLNYWSDDFQEIDSYSLLVDTQSGRSNMIVNSTVELDPALQVVWNDATQNAITSINGMLAITKGEAHHPLYYSLLLTPR